MDQQRWQIVVAVAASALLATAALADPPPARPDYLLQKPEGRWQFARSLSKDERTCTADQCEGGWRDGDFVLSVRRYQRQFTIVGGFANCPTTTFRISQANELDALTEGEVLDWVTSEVGGVVSRASERCQGVLASAPDPDVSGIFTAQ